MGLISWPKKLLQHYRFIYSTRKGKYVINIIGSVLFTILGGILYALFLGDAPISYWSKIGILFTSGVATVSLLLLVVERIFKIELYNRNLDLTNIQIDNTQTDINFISQEVADRIVNLASSELVSYDTIYEERAKHYKREKKALATNFVNMLGERVEFLKETENKDFQIIIDSGSTLAPIFDVIGKQASIDPRHWSSGIEFFTNNIKGVQNLLKYRANPCELPDVEPIIDSYSDRYLEIPISCSILPGKILSAYGAIADKTTIRATHKVSQNKNTYNICITTGNYILFEPDRRIFLPIARTGYHPNMKAILYAVSDEIYVVAPLGKILKGDTEDNIDIILKKFNDDLGYKKRPDKKSLSEYHLIKKDLVPKEFSGFDSLWESKSILVTTQRIQGKHNFFEHYNRLKDNLVGFLPGQTLPKVEKSTKPYIWTCEFDELPPTYQDQDDDEIPHENLRPFKEKYFWVKE
jgi:hypothetical protein